MRAFSSIFETEREVRRAGRPRVVELSDSEIAEIAGMVAGANCGRGEVSLTMAVRVWAGDKRPDILELLNGYSSKHTMPVVFREVAARVRPLVDMHRDRRMVRNMGGAHGHMRMFGDRRLLAGEQFSFDDATINGAVCVPWPRGGDKCSDRYGVRVGRFQFLAAHCDGTSMLAAYVYQIRESQGYRGADAVSLVNRLCRDVCRPDRLVLEGGVWQGSRMSAAREALGVKLLDAKGRPNQKLIENFFNRFWTRMALELPAAQLGRFRAEERENSELYLKCRAGTQDPRKFFPMLADVLSAFDRAITWLNNEPIQSAQYGRWIPAERWAEDMEANPRVCVSEEDVPTWTTAPVLEVRVVRRGQVSVTADGPCGESLKFVFCSPALLEWEGREVRVAFDPLLEGAGAEVVERSRPRVICVAQPVSGAAGVGLSDAAAEARAMRDFMRREYRCLVPGRRRQETEVRVPSAPAGDGKNGRDGNEGMDLGRRAAAVAVDVPERDYAAEIEENEKALRRGGLVLTGLL